jgi:hypothetical protein
MGQSGGMRQPEGMTDLARIACLKEAGSAVED